MISRRRFLGGAAVSAAALSLLGPEILIPKGRKIFLAPRGGWTVGRHMHYGNFWQPWRWDSNVQERYRALFTAIQNQEWVAGPDLLTPDLRDLYDYARGVSNDPKPLQLDLGWFT